MLAKYDAVNAPALKRLASQGAVLKPFPLPIMEAAYKSAHDIYNEIAAGNADFKKALDSMTTFRGEQLQWWQVGEFSFDAFMLRMRSRT
jgi:TRAP-type mannitol/chloroaromatic compound transport system substrate-binding protein